MKKLKILSLIVIGNILEYYDFLLFAHIGYVITPMFIPQEYSDQSYLFSLLIFSLPFIIRPFGGWFFGRVADKFSTNKALDATLCYASMASMIMAILPNYSVLGMFATALFITFRALQGFALGGEYTTAGTFLMDRFAENRSLVSGILGASGTVGSIIAFAFATIYIKFFNNTEWWRLCFAIGAIATYISYYFRKKHLSDFQTNASVKINNNHMSKLGIYKTLSLGAIASVSCFIPMVYTNFYFTQILNLDVNIGLLATLVSLVTYIFMTPIAGYISDKVGIEKFIPVGFSIVILTTAIGFYLISQGSLWGQLLLTINASIVGANIHVIMHQLFPLPVRSRNINFYFSVGASSGGLVPVISGYANVHYGFSYTPLIIMNILLVLNLYLFNQYSNLILVDNKKIA